MYESWTARKAEHQRTDVFELCWGRLLRVSWTTRRSNQSVLNIHWKDWCWSWNSNFLATWWEELAHLKRPWCWERLKVEGEEDNRCWDSWMASVTQWTWVWASSGSCDGQGGLVCSSAWGREDSDTTEGLNWTEPPSTVASFLCFFPSSPLLFQDQWIAVSPHSSGNTFVTKPSSLANKSFVAVICSYLSSWLYLTRFLAIAAVRE